MKLITETAGLVTLAMLAVFGLVNALQTRAQSQPATGAALPSFDVVSIKLNIGCANRPRSVPSSSPGRLDMECTTLKSAIESAYGVFANGVSPNLSLVEVSGGPSWVSSDFFEIVAKADGNPPLTQMQGPMLQALLEQRFKLMLHRETKEVPIYALTVAKSGAKLKRSQEGGCVPVDLNALPPPPAPGQPLPNFCGRPTPGMNGKNVTMEASGMTMQELAEGLLSRVTERKVIDRTGLTGMFDMHLEFTPDDTTPLGAAAAPIPSAGSDRLSIFTALEEQLGLKLESQKGPVDVLVIDHIEEPSPN
jgi:uncharacterized protein (TIGR03435 family)